MKRFVTAVTLLLAVVPLGAVGPHALSAQDQDSARIAELERQMEAVSRELESMRLGRDVVVADSSVQGFGPAASKIYRVQQGASIGGYGEILYENYAAEAQDGATAGPADRWDALRAILYVGYKFNDRLLFNSEIEVEHADEIFLEFAYLDYLIGDNWGVRGGVLLAPIGLVNELHEPAAYLGTERSITESRIIPSTWRENGIGLFGGTDQVAWRVYAMNSFDAAGFNGGGLRGGRQKASGALAEDIGVAARLDFVGRPGLIFGASTYVGETAHDALDGGGEEIGGRVLIWEGHVDYKWRGWDLRALVAGASVSDVAELNALNGLTGAAGIGTRMLGWYGQVGYDVLRTTGSPHQLIPYVRYEEVDTQREVAAGFAANPANDVTATLLGVAWKPVPQVVAKVDYQLHSNAADTGVDQFNFQIGWLF
ncbi:MAG TPA: hypothetical protein VMM35_05405 [Longimicrobiales bacterium]|nr:hypothetical protein [Longimicrobiales bacterium]